LSKGISIRAGVVINGIPTSISTSDVVEIGRDVELAPAFTGSGGVFGSIVSLVSFDEIPLVGIDGTLVCEVLMTGVVLFPIDF
jgi:hypothetical protein